MIKKAWATEELSYLKERYEAGVSDEEIARHLGRTVNSVSNCRQAHRITRPRDLLRYKEWLPEELSQASALYASGVPNAEIAARLKRTRTAIKRLVTDRGFVRDMGRRVDPSIFDEGDETWRRVADLPYAVSSFGRVLSLVPGKVGHTLASWTDEYGYIHVTLQVGGRAKRHAVHRLVTTAFHGAPPSDEHQAAHYDGVPSNNRFSNLRWATAQENQADRLIHGTATRGEGGRFVKAGTANMVKLAREAGVEVIEVGASV